jgi:hypothetical protein
MERGFTFTTILELLYHKVLFLATQVPSENQAKFHDFSFYWLPLCSCFFFLPPHEITAIAAVI